MTFYGDDLLVSHTRCIEMVVQTAYLHVYYYEGPLLQLLQMI